MRRHLTIGEAAKLLDVAPRTVTKACDGGHLKHHRLPGGDRRIAVDDFVAFARGLGKEVSPEDLPISVVPRLLVVSGVDVAWLGAALGPDVRVLVASTTVEAGAVLGTHEFAGLAVDAGLGRLDAANVVAYARSKKVRRTTRVASIQDRDGPPQVEGAQAVLTPTLDRAEVVRRIQNLISSHRSVACDIS